MEIEFPQGDMDYKMSSELQNELYKKMKRVVWKLNGSTAFCVDPSGILLCSHRGVTEKVGKDLETPLSVVAEQDDRSVECDVVLLWNHFDTAVLRIVKDDNDDSECFDYVSVLDDHFSRNLPFGMELFSIGLCGSSRIQFLKGNMSYKFEKDEIEYSSLLDDEKCVNEIERTGLYINTSCRTVNQVLPSDNQLHPRLNIIEYYYPGLSSIRGHSGAPIFNSKGRLIGMNIRQSNGLVFGLPSSALKVVVDEYARIRFEGSGSSRLQGES